MLIKFNGTYGHKEGGCKVCNARKQVGTAFIESKYYVLPSGMHRIFRKGQVTEVNDTDGEYLLNHDWTYKDNTGNVINVFEKVE